MEDQVLRLIVNHTTNDTSCQSVEAPEEKIVITVLRLFFSAVIVVFGGTGNALVMLAYRNPRMKTDTNLLIANLAFADFLVSVINVPIASAQATLMFWPFGLFLCKALSFSQAITLAASVGTLTAIAVDRFNSIVRPLNSKFKAGQAKLVSCAIWLCSAAFSSPLLIFTKVVQKPCTVGKFGCIETWTDLDQKLYTLVTFLLLYLFPLVAICILYYLIGRKLTNAKKSQTGSQRAKRKVIRMLVIVVIIFAVCCLPYHALFLYLNYIGKVYNLSLIHFVQWLFYANSACNPIVYAVFNTNYRREFMKVLRCRLSWFSSWFRFSRTSNDSFSKATFKRTSPAKSSSRKSASESHNACLNLLAEDEVSPLKPLQMTTISSLGKPSASVEQYPLNSLVMFESGC